MTGPRGPTAGKQPRRPVPPGMGLGIPYPIPRPQRLHPDLYAKLIAALGHAEHGGDWELTTGWGKDAKAYHTTKYERYLAALLPLLDYEPPGRS